MKKSVNEGKLCDPFAKLIRWHEKGPKKRKPDGTDKENAIMHDCSLRVIVLWRRNEPQSTKTSKNTLLCEVTIDSICKCFVFFFHPLLRIKSKTIAYR